MKQNGVSLSYASNELKNNRNVALAAVTQNGNALQFVSNKLQSDQEVVMTAVARCVGAIRFASKGFIVNDADIVVLRKKLREQAAARAERCGSL